MKILQSIALTRKSFSALPASLLAHAARPARTSTRLLALAAALPLLASHAHAQAVWSGLDDRGSFWSYGRVVDAKGNVVHVGNWSGGLAPGAGGLFDVYLGAPGTTLCDVKATLSSLTLAPGGALNMDTSSSLTVTTTDIQRDGALTEGGYAGGQHGAYTNAGTFTKTAGTGTFTLAPTLYFNSLLGSTIAVDSGVLQLPGVDGIFDTVTFVPAAGTTINLVTPNTASVAYSAHFQGILSNGAGTGTVLLSGGTMSGTQRTSVSSPQPCTLAFTGSVFQWMGGYIGSYQQGAIFNNVGVVNISGDATKETDATFTNQGLVIQSGAGQFNVGDANSGGSFTNAAGATYDLQSDASIGQSSYPFNNVGLFKKSGGTGTSTMTVSFRNQGGTVEVDSGTLQLPVDNSKGMSTGGVFNVAPGALLDLGGNTIFTGTYTGVGGGTVRLSQGSLFADKPNATVFNFPGTMFQWTGGNIGGYQGGQVFTNTGMINLSGDGDKVSYSAFTNQGTFFQTGAGTFYIGQGNSGGSFTNAAGATYDLQSDGGIGGGYLITNAGLMEKTAGTGVSKMDAELTNTGTISVNAGTLNFTERVNDISGTTLAEGTWNVADGATLAFQNYSSLTVNKANVALSGVNSGFPAIRSLADNQGTFALLALRQFATVGNLTNEGTLVFDAGSTLHVGGDFTGSGANSILAVTIGGTARQGSGSPGVLQSNGAATVAGNLSLTFAKSAVLPGNSDTLTIVSAGSPVTGSFANVASGGRLATTDGSGSFRVSYGAGTNAVVLSDFLRPGQTDVPTATLSAAVPTVAANSGQQGEFLLTLSSAPTSDVVVNFTIKGTAANGTDYTLLKSTKKIKAGKTSKPIKITPLGVGAGPGIKRTVVLTLQPGDGYQIGTTGKVKVKIIGQ